MSDHDDHSCDDVFGHKPGCNNESPIPNITAEEMAQHFVALRKQVGEIHAALVGNAYVPKGFIKRLTDVEEKVEAHDRKLVLWSSMAAAIGLVAAFFKDLITGK